MSTKKMCAILAVAAAASLVSPLGSYGIVAEIPGTLLLIPARYRMVELGFDVARLQNIGLLSYEKTPKTDATLLYLWNGHEWSSLSLEQYRSGNFLLGNPERIIAIGDQRTLPEELAFPPAWCANLARIDSMEISVLVNRLGAILKFKDSDWQWLAAKYHLTLIDKNAARRRTSRYGDPRSAAPQTAPVKPAVAPATSDAAVGNAVSEEQLLQPATRVQANTVRVDSGTMAVKPVTAEAPPRVLNVAPPMATVSSPLPEGTVEKAKAPAPQDK